MSKNTSNELGGKATAADDWERDTNTFAAKPQPQLDQAIQKHLGRKLQATYNDLVNQPVPDKFRQLLDELERQEKQQ